MRKLSRYLAVFSLLITAFIVTPSWAAQADTFFPAQINEEFISNSISAGGISTLNIYILNPNTFPITLSNSPAAFSETLPTGLAFTSPANATTTCGGLVTASGTTLSLAGGTVPAKAGTTSGSCLISVKVTTTVPGTYDNAIPINVLNASNPSGTIQITNTQPASVTLTVLSVQPPSLSKSFNKNTIWAGRTSIFTLSITNNDLNSSLTKTAITDSLPSGISLQTAAYTSNNCGSPTVTQADGSALAVGTTSIKVSGATIPVNSLCTLVFTVTSTTPGVYLNSIPAHAIQTQQGVTNTSAASAPLNVQNIGLAKSFSPTNVQAGGMSTLTITLQNPSSADYTGVSITDNLPSGMTVVVPSDTQPVVLGTTCTTIANPATVSTNASNSTVTLSGGTIPAANAGGTPGSCTITAKVTVTTAGSYTNSIPVNSLSTDIPGVTNYSSATANLSVYTSGAGISASKGFSPLIIPVGGTSRLSISMTAPADVDLHSVSIMDALPAGLQVADTPAKVIGTYCGSANFTPASGDTLLTFSGGTIPATRTCTFSVMVVSTNPTAKSYTNVISRTNISDDENRNISNNISGVLTISGLSVAKSFYPTTVNLGGISTLSIQLTNQNAEELDGVKFTDSLPAGLVVANVPNITNTCGGTLSADPAATSISLDAASIPAQVGTVAGICTVNVDVQALTAATKNNSLGANSVQGTLKNSGVTITNPQGTSATLEVKPLTIGVNKSFNPIEVHALGSSTLSVLLTNTNSYKLVGINFEDDLPQSAPGIGISIAPAPNATNDCGGIITANPGDTSFTFSGGYLDVNTSCTVSVDVSMNYDGNLINIIPIGAVTSTNGGSNDQEAHATLYNSPGASVTKTFSAITGHDATLTITIDNLNGIDLTTVGLVDTFPAHVTALSADPNQCGGTVSTTANSVSLANGTIASNESCDIVVQVEADAAGSYKNCIAANSLTNDQVATNPEDACDTLTVTDPVLPPQIQKSFSPASIPLGSNSVVSFKISNPNAVALEGVAFTDDLPANMTLTSIPNVSQCGGTVSSTPTSLRLTGGTIGANTNCTVTAGVTTSSAGNFVNDTSVVTSTNGHDGNSATATLSVVAPPQIQKSFTPANILANGVSTLTFTLTAPDANEVPLTGVAFIDPLPAGVVVAAAPNNSFSTDCGAAAFHPIAGDTSLSFSDAVISAGAPCTVTVDVTAVNGGVYQNKTEVITSTNGGSGNTASATLSVEGAGLTLAKSANVKNFKAAGDTIQYTYLLTNSGSTDLSAPFMVNDDHISGPIDCSGTTTTLAAGDSLSCTADYLVTSSDITVKTLTNTASATAVVPLTGDTVDSNQSSVTLKLARITIDKSTSTLAYISAGNTINYSYTLTNTGLVTLYKPFTVTDDKIGLPLGTAFSCGSVDTLAPGANVTCSSTYTVTAADVSAGTVTNSAFASGFDAVTGGNVVKSQLASVTVYKVVGPTITKVFSPDVIAVGQTSTMTFTISNPNPVPLTGVKFTDAFPSGLSMVTTPDQAQCGGTVAWNSTTNTLSLTNGSIIGPSCTITALVSADNAQTYTNTTSIVSTTNGGNGNSATDILTVVQGAVISKSFSPTTIFESGTSTLTILLSNPAANTQALSGVAFTDSFPAGLQVAAVPNSGASNCGIDAAFTATAGATSLSFSNGTIAVGQTCTLNVDVTAPAAGTYENTTSATASTNGGGGATSNTAVLQVVLAADLSVTKTDGKVDVSRGENLTYTMVVNNFGPSAVTGAQVYDAFPSTLTTVTWTCAAAGTGASCTPGGSGTINDTVNLPVDATLTYTVNAKVASTAAASILNNVTVYPPVGITDTNPANNSASDIDSLNLLTITKTANISRYSTLNTNVIYTYTVKNSGTSTLYPSFTVVDDKLTPTCPSIPLSMAPGDTFTCTGSHLTNQADLDAGSIVNNVYATATDSESDPVVSTTVKLTIPATQTSTLKLTKTLVSGNHYTAPNQLLTYSYLVQNTGNVTLTAPFAVTDNKTTVDCSSAPASLAPTASFTCSATYSVKQSDVDAGSVVNVASATGKFKSATVTSNTDTKTAVADQTLKLTLVKSITAGATYNALTDVIHYSYLLKNEGNVTLQGTGSLGVFTVSDNKTTVTCPATPTSLAPNDTVTCTATYAITQNDLDNGSLTNLATAHSKFGATVVDSNQDSQTAAGIQTTGLTLTKSISSGDHFTAAGQVIAYGYLVKNTGNVTLTAPFAVSDNKTTVDCSSAPASLAPTASFTCSSTYSVSQPDMDFGSVVNVASATGNFKATVVTSNTDTKTATGDQTLKLSLVKTITAGASYDSLTDVIDYSYLLKNEGNVTLHGTGSLGEFTVSDSKTTVTCPATPTSLAPNDTVTCTATYAITQADLDNGSVTNTATAHSKFGTTPVDSNEDSQTATGTQTTGLTLTKSITTGDNFTAAGQVISYSYLLKNTGNVTLTAPFVVTDNKTTVDCSLAPASLAPLGTFTCASAYTVTQADMDAGSVVNEAYATGNFKITVVTSNTDTQTATGIQSKKLTLEKTIQSGDHYSAVGDLIHYNYLLRNDGNVTLHGVGASGEFTVSDDKVTVSCPASPTSLLPGETVTCTATYTANQDDLDVGKVVNTAVGHSQFITEPVDSNTDTQQANADQNPSLTILKEVSTTDSGPWENDLVTVTVGAPVYYRITVKNTGNITLTSVNLQDDQCTVSAPTGDVDADGKLDVDETWVYTCSVISKSGTHQNTATVTTDETDLKSDIANYFAQRPLIGMAKQAVSVKEVSTGTYDVTYLIRVQNFGNIALNNLVLTDDMAATYPAPVTFAVRSITSSELTINAKYNGSSDKNLLVSGNSIPAGITDSITLVVRVVPPSHGPYNNSATISGTSSLGVTVTDISQNGTISDSDHDGDPTNNNDPTPVDFGPRFLKPVFGVKTLNQDQMPVMIWTMSWINNKNIVPVAGTVHDPIPLYTRYIPDFTDSGFPVPAGAPAGSTSKGVTCTASGKSTTSLCYYEGPTPANPLGQIIWQGVLAPDFGVTDPVMASNAVKITFSSEFQNNSGSVENIATIDSDLNGNGNTTDDGEQKVATASAIWYYVPPTLPKTGFTPGIITQLPDQPKALAYDALGDMWLEIPNLGLQSSIIGVPESNEGWNISWLGKDIGWLNGTAFPTHSGNAVLTGHVYDANGQPGPFTNLEKLKYGDQIIVHAWNQEYIYEVRETKTIAPTDSQAVLDHEDLPWITLLTCRDYDAKTDSYLNRYIVKAVLIKVQ